MVTRNRDMPPGTSVTTTAATPPPASSSSSDSSSNVIVGPDINASRSPYDKKLYRHITLPNGLQALLIQDTVAMQQQRAMGGYEEYDDEDDMEEEEDDEDDRNGKGNGDPNDDDDEDDDDAGSDSNLLRDAACSIVVGVGSVSDTPIHGMAHFCEHLLFMGSQKYPDENEYSSYVSRYGGSDNAYTEWEYTIYNVNVPNGNIWGAVDRLAQFFIAPLFLEDAVHRELNSIESEFVLNQNNDTTRRQQLLCSTCHIHHPICKFSWGNTRSIQTIPQQLGIDPMQILHEFYHAHYYAHNIRVVIQGAYTLDELQDGIIQYFSDVPPYPRTITKNTVTEEMTVQNMTVPPGDHHNQQLQMMNDAGLPFRPSILGTITRIVPIKECHSLTVTWQLPSQFPNWKCKPMDYISHLLGHEASGSILSYVRQQAWATACMAGYSDEGSDNATSHAFFSMTLSLSEQGVAHWSQVVIAIYEYIAMLRKQSEMGWPQWIYDELQQIHALSYKYGDESSPDETVEHFAEQMSPHNHTLPLERILDGNALLFEFDETLVASILNEYMKPELARIDLTSSIHGKAADFETTNGSTDVLTTATIITDLIVKEADAEELNNSTGGSFDVSKAGMPQVDPMFGTQFWCHKLSATYMDQLMDAVDPNIPLTIGMLHLPPQNTFIPQSFGIKSLPIDDCDHPLLNAAIKLCIVVGKTKQWFPATIVQYNQKMNRILCSYEDDDEKWHVLDHDINVFNDELLCRYDTFEGTMDKKAIKFRIVAIALYPGMKGAGIRKYGDETDNDVDDGTQFPPIPSPSKHLPVQISNSNVLKMWWLQDRKFKRPITEFRIQVTCPAIIVQEPLHRACTDLLRKLCADALMETVYLAEMCELECTIDATDTGFYFRFYGFDDKLLDLFTTAMTLFLSFTKVTDTLPEAIAIDRFQVCLEILQRQYKNSGTSSSSLSNGLRLRAIRPTIYSSSEKMKALDGITIKSFCQTISSIFESFSVEAFMHGNVTREDANKARDALLNLVATVNCVGLARKQYPPQSVLRIPNVLTPSQIIVPSFNPNEHNTSCDVYIQVGKDNVHDRVVLDLLMHMMDNPIYDQIRTQDQFGYDVYCSGRWTFGILGCIFHVTTNVKTASEVVERIDKFIVDFRNDLVDMPTKDFQENLVGLAKQKLDMYNCLSEETDTLWSEIDNGRFEWESWRNETVCLKDISKDVVLKALDEWILPGKKRHILSVQVIGSGKTDASMGRPVLENDLSATDYADERIHEFRNLCKSQIWGRINSKLF